MRIISGLIAGIPGMKPLAKSILLLISSSESPFKAAVYCLRNSGSVGNIIIVINNFFEMDKQKTLDDKVAEKYKKAKELPPADVKLILLGDSAVGKSK